MHTIYHDLWIEASPNAVFEAVTSPEHLINWWPQKCSGTPELGSSYNFFFTPEYDWYGKVVEVRENESFHIKMTRSDTDWDPTSFGYDLQPENKGTALQFRHKDWPACNHHFRTASFCWAILLRGLKEYVEKGIVVPFAERE